jgi:hypothetical protein
MADNLWESLGDAVADIREKLVEEPMWGRALSGPEDAPQWPQAVEPSPAPAQEQEHAPEPDLER